MRNPARNRRCLAVALLGLAALAACGPVPVEQAERSCMGDFLDARGPQSRVTMGISATPGRIRPHAGLEVSLSSDAMRGGDPSDAYNRCVLRRSGRMPTRTLSERLGVHGP